MKGELLFECKHGSGASLTVVQTDPTHVVVTLSIGDGEHIARLPAGHAVAFATAILAANPGALMHFAEGLDDATCAMLGQAFLVHPAQRALDRQAARGAGTPEAS